MMSGIAQRWAVSLAQREQQPTVPDEQRGRRVGPGDSGPECRAVAHAHRAEIEAERKTVGLEDRDIATDVAAVWPASTITLRLAGSARSSARTAVRVSIARGPDSSS